MIGAVPNPFGDRARLAAVAAPLLVLIATAVVLADREIVASSIGSATPLLLALALVFGGLVVRYSGAGAAALVCFIYLDLSEALVRYHNFPSLLQLLVIGLVFAAWLKYDIDRVDSVALQPLTLASASWLVMAFVSTGWALDRRLADDRFGDLVKAFTLYLLLTLLMRNRRRVMQAIAALIGSAFFLGSLSVYQFATGQTQREFGGLARFKQAQIYGDVFQPRIAGPVGDPNFFAEVLLIVIPVAVMIAWRARPAWKRMAILAIAAVIVFTLVLTYSRGALLALAVAGVMMVRALRLRWTSIAAAGVALLIALILLPVGVSRRLVTIEQILPGDEDTLHPDSSFAERRVLMEVALAMFAAHPTEGVGIGNYSAQYDDYVGDVGSVARLYPGPTPLHYPHNLYLEIAAETGVAGLILFGCIVVAFFHAVRDARRGFAAAGDDQMATIASALGISMVAFLVASLFLHLAVPRYLFLLFAFVASLQRIGRGDRGIGGSAGEDTRATQNDVARVPSPALLPHTKPGGAHA